MTNRGIIAAALILGASIIFAVWLPLHYQTVRRLDQEHKADCAEQKAGLERCLDVPYPTNEARASCREAWMPVIAKACK
jgi:hypothetical protein